MPARIPKHILVSIAVAMLAAAGIAAYRLTRPRPAPVKISDVSWEVDGTTCTVSFKARNAGAEGVDCTFRIKPYHMPKGSRMIVRLGRRDITMFLEPGKTIDISQDVRIEVAPRNQTPVTGIDITAM